MNYGVFYNTETKAYLVLPDSPDSPFPFPNKWVRVTDPFPTREAAEAEVRQRQAEYARIAETGYKP